MPPSTPSLASPLPALATRCGTGRLTALSLAVGLGLLAGPARCAHRAAPPSAPAISLPCVETARAPLERAPLPPRPRERAVPPHPRPGVPDLVGIYRAGRCTLVLDASGTYRSGCSDGRHHPYAIEGDHVVLDGPAGRVRLWAAPGELVSDSGTVYTITGGVR